LTRSDFATTSGEVTPDNVLRARLLDELTRRQLPSGGLATSNTLKQTALEPSCLAALALGLRSDSGHGVQEFLLRVQNPNESWPAFDGDDPDGAWVTSLAMIALRDYVPGIPARLRGFHWLLKSAGKESNWLWKGSSERQTDTFALIQRNMVGPGLQRQSVGSSPLALQFWL
jgi:hypothetical protein